MFGWREVPGVSPASRFLHGLPFIQDNRTISSQVPTPKCERCGVIMWDLHQDTSVTPVS